MNDIIVVDDVLFDIGVVRGKAKQNAFSPFPFQGLVFPGLAITGDLSLFNAISRILDRPVRPVVTYFRLGNPSDVHPTFIHQDVGLGTHSAILYLNDGPTGDGTAFWLPLVEGADPLREGEWIMKRLVQQKENRLLIFPGSVWHSRYPQVVSSPGRLIQVAFFNVD